MIYFDKIFLSAVMICVVAFSGGDQIPQPGYTLKTKDGAQIFTNYADGYCVTLDGGFTVDLFFTDVGAVLCSDDTQIELYKQSLKDVSSNSYSQYSNGFLSNRRDHRTIFKGRRTIGNNTVYVTAWSREKLQRVDNDRNYYVSFDIIREDAVYSIFIKTATPFESAEQFYGIAESFRMLESADYAGIEYVQEWSGKAVDPEEQAWNAETIAFYQTYFADDAELAWGIYEPLTVVGNSTQIAYYEDVLEYRFPVVLCYSHFVVDPNAWSPYMELGDLLEMTWQDGHAVELTLQTTTMADGSNMMYDILQGVYDEFLYDYAQSIALFGRPVLFRLHNEMNGDWCPYAGYNTSKDTMIYKEVYWYIYGIFEETGANRNTIWVWNPNSRSFPNFNWNHSLMYYPGDEYVDIVGMTAYNTGTYYARYGERWQEFETLYEDLYSEYCRLFEQPLMITEFSCANAGGDKNAWVENMFRKIGEYDRIKVAVWWDHVDYDADGNVSRSYVLDETPELLEIFRKHLAQ